MQSLISSLILSGARDLNLKLVLRAVLELSMFTRLTTTNRQLDYNTLTHMHGDRIIINHNQAYCGGLLSNCYKFFDIMTVMVVKYVS